MTTQPITDRNLEPDTLLTATYKGASYLSVVRAFQDENHLDLEIIEGATDLIGSHHRTLSRAAMAITGNSVNGWRFWRLAAPPAGKTSDLEEDARTLNDDELFGDGVHLPRGAIPQDARVGATAGKAPRKSHHRYYNPIRVTPNQKALKHGGTRFWCDGCQASFESPDAVAATKQNDYTCPHGHEVGEMRSAAAQEA